MLDLRPISLCNVFYKIIAKIFADYLRPIMNKITDMEQNAFIRDRLISDNILISHELMHSLKIRRREHNYRMAVNLDINKASECVEWDFLKHMLNCMGFEQKWIFWIL